jgi:tape measure domain-containing protein
MADEQVKIGIVAEDKTGAGVASAKRNLQSLNKTVDQTGASLSKAAQSGIDFRKVMAGVGTAVAVIGLKNMAGAALQSYASYERLSQSINAMAAKEALLSGSATNMAQALAMTKTQSKETLQWISKLAIQSPFKQEDVAQAFRLAQALGFNTQEAKRLTAATLDWATATGAQGMDIERVNRALGQMKTKGKVSQEEINQLTEAGVDAGRILSGAFGKSGEALEKAFRNGEITSSQAIEAIIKDMERLYQGAGKESANSMQGLLSTMEELQDIAGRNLFGGMFQTLQPYIAEVTGILGSPEFQAGLTGLGAGLGAGLGEKLDAAAASAEKITAAIEPLLDAAAPGWLVALQALATATGTDFKVTITPEITTLKLPPTDPNNPGSAWKVDVTANATTITAGDGSYLTVDAKAQSITLAPGVGLPPLTIQANITPESQATLDALYSAAATGGAKAFGLELGNQTRLELAKQWSATVDVVADWGTTWTDPHSTDADVTGNWGNFWNEAHSVIATIIPDLSQMPGWLQNALGGLGLNPSAGVAPNTGGLRLDANGVSVVGGTGRERATTTQAKRDPSKETGTGGIFGKAIGTGFHRGGMAWVGEQGPEAVWLPRGTEIMTNRDSKAAFGLPHYAEGTSGAAAFGNSLRRLLRLAGIDMGSSGGEAIGPPTRAEWNKTFNDVAGAGIKAAERTGDAFVAAADDTAKAFASTLESALGQVPGLFGTSQVTDRDMQMAKAGVYQEKADEYLRQLSDEVLNGKDHGANVDIKDAARRAGIDPNLPNEIVLELVKEDWANQSFFANAANLDLINTDAVKASLEQQQKESQGKANIMAMFGLTDESSQQTADQLGAALNTVFGQAAESDAMKQSGVVVFNKLLGGFTDPATATAGVGAMGTAITAATGAPENVAVLEDAGKSAYRHFFTGWAVAAGEAPVSPPAGYGPPPGPGASAPGRAIGEGFWAGGYMTVHKDETLYAPRGTRVARPGEGMSLAAATVVNYVTINQQIDEEAFLAKMARRLRAGR